MYFRYGCKSKVFMSTETGSIERSVSWSCSCVVVSTFPRVLSGSAEQVVTMPQAARILSLRLDVVQDGVATVCLPQDIGVRRYRNGPKETCVAQEGRTQEEGCEAPWCVAQARQQEGRTQAQEALQEGLGSQ
jgi:hypothetical protein